MQLQRSRRRQSGFTMIEIMLVVVIIGIMSSIAIPYYLRSSARAYRSEAQITISKFELYFKNLYENSGTFTDGTYIITSPDMMPDPAGTTPVGQGVDWKAVAGHGWDNIPFPPQGDIRMRYLYLVNNSASPPTVTLTACGSVPGLGVNIYAFGGHSNFCNYLYSETMQGTSIDPNTGVSELPQAF
jgi:prepilin-type N-terminal cleavage/methylation domain-containing protein